MKVQETSWRLRKQIAEVECLVELFRGNPGRPIPVVSSGTPFYWFTIPFPPNDAVILLRCYLTTIELGVASLSTLPVCLVYHCATIEDFESDDTVHWKRIGAQSFTPYTSIMNQRLLKVI